MFAETRNAFLHEINFQEVISRRCRWRYFQSQAQRVAWLYVVRHCLLGSVTGHNRAGLGPPSTFEENRAFPIRASGRRPFDAADIFNQESKGD